MSDEISEKLNRAADAINKELEADVLEKYSSLERWLVDHIVTRVYSSRIMFGTYLSANTNIIDIASMDDEQTESLVRHHTVCGLESIKQMCEEMIKKLTEK